MNNYIDHETEVKFMDGLLSKSQDWQWFICYIETNYDLEDVSTYDDFQKKSHFRRLLEKLRKLLEVSDRKLKFNKPVLHDIYNIARFSVGAITVNGTKRTISTNVGRVLLSIVWLNKTKNSDNATDHLIDLDFLLQKNYFQSINMQSFITEGDKIIKYINSISLTGFAEPRKCIIDNLKSVSYGVSNSFFENYGDKLISANAFRYQSLICERFLTWQEYTLLDMLNVSISKKTVSPTESNCRTVVPEHKEWTSDLINKLKCFFNNPKSDFVLESMDYIKNGIVPSKQVVDTHCRFLKELLEKADDSAVYSSSYKIIASLFSDGSMRTLEKTGDVLELIKCIKEVKSIAILLVLRNDSFYLSKNQNLLVNQYITEQYKRIKDIDDIYQLNNYFENKDIAKNITQTYYDMIMPKFMKFLEDPRHQIVPLLFYQAMLFLIDVNQTNQKLDRRTVKKDMISLQEYWQNNIYEEQIKTLHVIRESTSLGEKTIETFNSNVLENPIKLAQCCFDTKLDKMIEIMNSISDNPISHLIRKIVLSPIYPLEGAKVNFDNHEIDSLLRTQVDEIKEKYGYKFLNVLDTDIYVSGLHEHYWNKVCITIPMFYDEKKLYIMIENLLEINLIPYDNKILLGHLTQLFPLLENQIRKLGKIHGVVPFKVNSSELMKYKDPSSVLRELLESIYEEVGSFENAPDLLFVYHFMYNGNSLNIRNECIHGRNFTEGEQLHFAFKVTLLSLYMIIFRIKSCS